MRGSTYMRQLLSPKRNSGRLGAANVSSGTDTPPTSASSPAGIGFFASAQPPCMPNDQRQRAPAGIASASSFLTRSRAVNVSFEVQRNFGNFARHGTVLIRTENGGTSPRAGFASKNASYHPISASPCPV